ncbi:MAG: amino acid ABC transporter ATP-binding protein [Betaproteobacteria bacterium]|nr:amino acid ABC transporter ATP-binding protein [Betaproteobacteria bacterium]MBU6511965.1 amino acid ABC transporter ATP-binding protein [Betaproteobacteria bacterium]MDE1957282.1 amino acid ABC transporter ATP-binding protein [Betaproteobacteria bacterium]MDE2152195.1 amino acid ABC transporter ATP-binding protein [Betaproteobacteria bacterium]MDE2479772.1 amino acid ABC transporter ATP-binding protein [Betaproteobacteria bacterium]
MLLNPSRQAVRVRYAGVRKSYGAVEVLRGVELDVAPGTTTCIVGPSGSGKSTLLRCANLMERPDGGSVHIGDLEITAPGVDIDAVRARVGMVFQHFHLFAHLDVLGNVSLALRKVRALPREQAEALALEQLRAVGLQGLERRRPADLSGGQQQRVAIARSLAMQPQVMLFDEATSALDPELVKGVLALMRELAHGGMTMLVVTHEMRFAREVANQVVFVDRGQVLESAPADAFFDAPGHPRLREFLDQIL